MGMVYQPKYKAKDGTTRVSAIWWCQYRQNGKTERESTETTGHKQALAVLKERESKITLNIPVSTKGNKLTLTETAEMIRADYLHNGRKSGDTLEFRLARVLQHFGTETRLARLTTAHVERYKTLRLKGGASSATVNRELGVLGRMAALAHHQYGLTPPFHVAKFHEDQARQGFFERADLDAICRHLRPELATFARVAYLTGWRKSELRSRQWHHVDFHAGWMRLEPRETKNGKGRQFPLIPELRALLEAQRGHVEGIQRATGQVIPWVFCYGSDGQGQHGPVKAGEPLGDFKKAWHTATRRAGLPGKLVHDFRRTATRNLVRAGVPTETAMKLTGHLTRDVFTRYAIVDEGMLNEAGDKLAALSIDKVGTKISKVVSLKA